MYFGIIEFSSVKESLAKGDCGLVNGKWCPVNRALSSVYLKFCPVKGEISSEKKSVVQ